jgi:hypothetical protein
MRERTPGRAHHPSLLCVPLSCRKLWQLAMCLACQPTVCCCVRDPCRCSTCSTWPNSTCSSCGHSTCQTLDCTLMMLLMCDQLCLCPVVMESWPLLKLVVDLRACAIRAQSPSVELTWEQGWESTGALGQHVATHELNTAQQPANSHNSCKGV